MVQVEDNTEVTAMVKSCGPTLQHCQHSHRSNPHEHEK